MSFKSKETKLGSGSRRKRSMKYSYVEQEERQTIDIVF